MIHKHVTSNGLEMTEAIENYLDKKVESIQKFVGDADNAIARIELGRTTHHHHKGDVFRAEINLEYADHKFRAEATTDDLYKSIDTVRDEIVAEVTKSKKKNRDLIKKGRQKIKEILKGKW